jgi:hypothetical protein
MQITHSLTITVFSCVKNRMGEVLQSSFIYSQCLVKWVCFIRLCFTLRILIGSQRGVFQEPKRAIVKCTVDSPRENQIGKCQSKTRIRKSS